MMATWTYQKPARFSGRNGIGMAISIAVHIAVIAVALMMRTPKNETAPAPLIARVLDTPSETQEAQPIEQSQPKFDRPKLHIPQPDVAFTTATESPSAPVAVAGGARNAEPARTAPVTLPQFDADYLNNPSPQYPSASRRMREEGVVLVRVYVLSNGLPESIELKRSSGSHRLDHSALEAVRKWRFVPARRGDETVAAWVIVPVAFSLTA